MPPSHDVAARRLDADAYRRNFADIRPPFDAGQAAIDSASCLFCHDAPCVKACPTGIDIPRFIHGIATGNVRGAAMTILRDNILGGSCARVCPTEVLCEQVCVKRAQGGMPIPIGRLQRFATDHLMDRSGDAHPFRRAPDTEKRVAVVGAGPAGLACAHRLAMHGHRVDLYDADDRPGGLNQHGIAAYKLVDNFAAREVAFVLGIGGIVLHAGRRLGRELALAELRAAYDAVFLGIGLSGVNSLKADGEDIAGVLDAVAYIRELRRAADPATLPIGRRVVVVGGGNTAIDVAVQAKALGAEDATIVYRRGPDHMGATGHERQFAQTRDVRIRFWATPRRILGDANGVSAVEFERTRLDSAGRVVGTGETYTLDADMVFKAIGQVFDGSALGEDGPEIAHGRIRVDAEHRTSLPDVFAGGDCVAGPDLTVEAVRGGRDAAEAIHRQLCGT